MNDKRELRLQHLLKILEDNPTNRYAMITVNINMDPITLALCIRDKYYVELTITKANWDPFKLLKLVHEVKYG